MIQSPECHPQGKRLIYLFLSVKMSNGLSDVLKSSDLKFYGYQSTPTLSNIGVIICLPFVVLKSTRWSSCCHSLKSNTTPILLPISTSVSSHLTSFTANILFFSFKYVQSHLQVFGTFLWLFFYEETELVGG